MMILTEEDIWLFREGSNFTLHEKLGAHPQADGTSFAVWAPNALSASVIGDFNGWDPQANPLSLRNDGSGIWEGFIPSAFHKSVYKYHFKTYLGQYSHKTDPFAFFCEQPPGNASIVWDISYSWNDQAWIEQRSKYNSLHSPILIYEIHHPSWRRKENNTPLSYLELASCLPGYIKQQGFTHVEFLPIMEHPLYGSWGYQTTGYFAPSSRYGTPQDFMHLIDTLHQAEIGVILDWVPSHFPKDSHGLADYDGTSLFEYNDHKKRTIPDWNTSAFDYSSPQIRSFLISNALFWLEKYHVDGIRVDAVASMLYLDYSRKDGEWEPNIYGGKENLESIDFLRRFNTEIYSRHPDIQTIAEESTAWPLVSRPTHIGGLGFGMKWNMGWMHDLLHFMSLDPLFRKYQHNALLFSLHYAFAENFILPLSHDEVVYGKRSLLNKMPGDEEQKFANLRLLFGYMYAHPGKKLLFMGGEFAQWKEWDHEQSLDWNLLEYPLHRKMQHWIHDLNFFYRSHPALYEIDFSEAGFEWIDTHAWEQSIIAFMRKSRDSKETILVIGNFTPVPRFHYRVGVPHSGFWKEILNSDSEIYGGSNVGNGGGILSEATSIHGRDHSVLLTLPPLGLLFFTM